MGQAAQRVIKAGGQPPGANAGMETSLVIKHDVSLNDRMKLALVKCKPVVETKVLTFLKKLSSRAAVGGEAISS